MNDVVNSWRQRVGAGMRYALFRKGTACDRRRLCRRFLPHQRKRGDARCASALHHLQRRGVRGGAAPVPGFMHRFVSCGRESRLRAHQVGRSGRASGDPAAISVRPDRSRYGGGGSEAFAWGSWVSRRCSTHCRGAGAGPASDERCRPARIRARGGDHRVSSDQHLPHGRGCERRRRRAAARARHWQSPRGRCLEHADGSVRQHQRGRRHDRGKRRRHDPAGCAATTPAAMELQRGRATVTPP